MRVFKSALRIYSLKFYLALFAFVLFSAACGGSTSSRAEETQGNRNRQNQAQSNEAPISISTAVAVSRQVPSYIQATGSLVASETSDVAPKAAGKVVNTYVNIGQFVGQGALIAKLDEREALLRLREAQAGVGQAQAAVRQAEARLGLLNGGNFQASNIPEVRAAISSFEQAQAELRQAEANEQRYRDLVQTGDTSMQNYESYRTQRDTARARVNAARQQQEAAINAARQSNEAIRSAQAGVEAARAQVATAQQAVADTTVRAPFSGFVSNRAVAVGEFVTTATPIVTLLRTNPLKLQMQVGEADVPRVSIGMGVSLEVEAFKDRKFAGTVTAVNPSVDPNSRSAIIEATVENPDNALRAGMFAASRIAMAGGNTAVYVPRTAVYNDQSTQSYRVFVIQDNLAKLRVVQLGTEEGDTVQILNGVNADEVVAVSNLNQLYEGARVEIIQ
ncbi:MAG: efflux RND transporter periplasmic adaptor subunit [Acidobacteriota bacterium]|nr:efflux RND transporter periplasmic adaptor subunit [Acidobacteriota bacterium]